MPFVFVVCSPLAQDLLPNSLTPQRLHTAMKNNLTRRRATTAVTGHRTPSRNLNGTAQDSSLKESFWRQALLYQRSQKWDHAWAAVEAILRLSDDPEDQARCFLVLGQLAEQKRQYNKALGLYGQGIALKPANISVAYLLHNNAGYCLNLEGKHVQAERHCRIAIELEPLRHNAWNNLAVSLEGQRNPLGAAEAYGEALKANASDWHSLSSLQELIACHPELRAEFSEKLKHIGRLVLTPPDGRIATN